ncbi:uracil-DNA glycosylase [Hypericibacter adhaerens]|uniref:Type-5 uracil-DNA glycosylase n=2 Tax=Hypericibacter adhaerens TaxID=2602016 RepID=A0A5J6N1E4_9PROT|nr:uracil-DNA glycosylase [Hypericibacter adhaerens]
MTPLLSRAAAVDEAGLDPAPDCPRCPRLVQMRTANRAAEPTWHNAPVPAFGALSATLLVVGLAPGLRGANRTGRPFTGDYAGDLLYGSLKRNGLARGDYQRRRDDGFELIGCRVTNAVRCVPPENKPTPAEIKTCNSFLAAELAAMPRLKGVLALGSIAHDALLVAAGEKRSAFRFAHGALHRLGNGLTLADSYHCSRLNTNTGRLTEAMFDAVVATLKSEIERG